MALTPGRRRGWYDLSGTITSAGFASGDRFVIGHWRSSPVGPMADIMWATPHGERRLLASNPTAAAFIAAIYSFDSMASVPFRITAHRRVLTVEAGDIQLELRTGRGWRLPVVRPAWFTRFVEGPIAWQLLGVRTFGTSPTGVRQWYRALSYRPLMAGRATVSGRDLGSLGPIVPAVGFGFSEPPRRASMVDVRPLLHDPARHLDHIVRTIQASTGWSGEPGPTLG